MATYSQVASGGVVGAGSWANSRTDGDFRLAFVARKRGDIVYVMRGNDAIRCVISGLNLVDGVVDTYVTNNGVVGVLDPILTASENLSRFRINLNDNENLEYERKCLNCLA